MDVNSGYAHICKNDINGRLVFMHRYEKDFIPYALAYQKQKGITGKILLLLDNSPAHPPAEELNAVHPNFEVLYLPPNTTAIFQPMDQGAIATAKKLYKKAFLRSLLLAEEDYPSVEDFIKQFTLKKCFPLMSDAWNQLKESTLRKVWKPLLGEQCSLFANSRDQTEQDSVGFSLNELAEISLKNRVPSNLDVNQIESWSQNVNTLEDDQGWEPLSDTELLENAAKKVVVPTEETNTRRIQKKQPLEFGNVSDQEAHDSINKALCYFQQEEKVEVAYLMQLSDMRDYIEVKNFART